MSVGWSTGPSISQGQGQNIWPDLDLNFDTLMVFLIFFSKTLNLKKKKKTAGDNNSMRNYPTCKELSIIDDDKAWLIDAVI